MEDCAEDADFLHGSRTSPDFDPVTHAERPKDEEHDARCEIRQGPLQGQTYGEAGSTKDRDELGCGDAENPQDRDDDKDHHGPVHQRRDEGDQRRVNPSGTQVGA